MKNPSSSSYEDRYNKHVEIITCLQELILIEEQNLFKLIQTKKQVKYLQQKAGKGLGVAPSLDGRSSTFID